MDLRIISIESLVNVNTNTYHCEEQPNDRITSQAGFIDERVRHSRVRTKTKGDILF